MPATILALLFTSCGSTDTPKEDITPKDTTSQNQTTPDNELADFKFHVTVLNIPSPFEIVDLLPKSELPFNKNLINPHSNASKYMTSFKKGVNYGVYGVDLLYLSTNEQYADVKKYYTTSRELAGAIGAGESFDKLVGDDMETNIENKDSINRIMDKLYTEMDAFLRSNEKLQTATEMLIGSWIESQYITLSLIKDADLTEKNKVLFQKVYEQRTHLQRLNELLAEYKTNKDFKTIIQDFTDLEGLYKELKAEASDKAITAKIHAALEKLRMKLVG